MNLSSVPQFRGKKAAIIEGLRRGLAPEAIARQEVTTKAYVNNVRSELRVKYGINFTSIGPREIRVPNVTNDEANMNQPAPSARGSVTPHYNTRAAPHSRIRRPESAAANPELDPIRQEVASLESANADKEEMLALAHKRHQLKMGELLLTGELELQRFVSEICPEIDTFWNSKEVYVEVMVKLRQNPLCVSYLKDKVPYWAYDASEYRLRLVLRQVFDRSHHKRPTTKYPLTESIKEFSNYHATHPWCPKDYLPGVPSYGGSWECPEHHNRFPTVIPPV